MGATFGLFWTPAIAAQTSFPVWLEELRQEALAQGISKKTLDAVLTGIEPIERVIELDNRQPEFTETFLNYLDARVTPQRITKGRELLQKHHALLAQTENQYGVPPRYIMAFWGMETNFGGYLGNHPTVNALATLAYNPRRGSFFRTQTLDALRILDQGHVTPEQMKGSWAGAMGQLQFMPSTFINHAVDADGDGRKDMWTSMPDVFASGANFLRDIGWKHGELWGREVRLPEHFNWDLAQLNIQKSVTEWSALGVTKADGRPLPKADQQASLVLPQGHAGPAFLVYNNFRTIMKWNRSVFYALAVGHLADRLIDLPPLRNGRTADNRRMSRDLTLELQQHLNALGFETGTPDGIPGTQTRAAVRAYQKSSGLRPDGYPSVSLLELVREEANRIPESKTP